MNKVRFEEIIKDQFKRNLDVIFAPEKSELLQNRLDILNDAGSYLNLEVIDDLLKDNGDYLSVMCHNSDGFSLEEWDHKITDQISYLAMIKVLIVELKEQTGKKTDSEYYAKSYKSMESIFQENRNKNR